MRFAPVTLARLIVAAALSLVATDPARAQPCPSSTIEFVPPGPAPVATTNAARSLSSGWDLGHGSADHDLVAGTIRVTSIGDPGGGFGAHARASDRYTLLGPVGIPAATFTVRLYVSGLAEGRNDGPLPGDAVSVTVSAVLLEAGGAQDSAAVTASPGQRLGVSRTLEIPVTREIGEPFELTMALHSQGGFSTGMLDGRISFILPSGFAIVSCQNFQGSGSTRATTSSWGRFKLRYR